MRSFVATVGWLVLGGSLGFVLAACGTRTVTRTVTVERAPSGRELVLYGHIESLTPKGGHFELRFDPAWLLTGVPAERAAIEDGVLGPGEPVPNDHYVVEEGHRLLTFGVLATAHATVLTRHGTGPTPATAITVAELAQIVAGRNPEHRRLLEPKAGFWIRVAAKYPSPVLSLDQQYEP